MDKRGNKNHKRGLNSIILDQWDIATSSSALMPDPSGTLICQTRINTLEEGHGENHASRSASILGPVFRINYDDTPATSFSAYLEHLPYTITSYISCRVLLKQCSPLSGGWVEWGQLAALILSILALIHWLFYTTCYRLYWCSLKPSVKGWPSVQHGSPNGLFVPSLDRPIWDYIAWLDSWKFLSYHPPLSPLDLLETRLAELRDGFGLWDINGVTRSLGHLKSMQAEFLMRELIDRLREAAREGREDFVQLLVNYGVPVNSKDSDGRTPLHWATRHGYEAAVRLLLETGKVSINSKDKYGKTALHEAVEHKRKAVVQLLLETKKGDINSKDRRGKTPLSIAAGKEDETMVQLLQSFTAKGSNH
ncbi:MAG: hypothetical protein M1822_003412 [Bathelium mastoideum]|nr:MAG: hypothetical protein M1822_003412 [Bathelium mastoideum]